MLSETRIVVPRPNARAVDRSSLLDAVDDPEIRVVVIVAPPGGGKTTLVASWAHDRNPPVAWFSLDRLDSDPVTFWAGLIASIRDAYPDFAPGLVATADIEGVLVPKITNALLRLPHPVTVVLDDFHSLDATTIEAQVAELIDRAPENLTVVLTSRTEPRLPLGRWRARGQLSELSTAELALDHNHAATLLNDRMGLALAASEIDEILDRTGGWAAGVYLIGRALGDRSDGFRQVTEGLWDHRYVVDFFGSEVLDGLSADQQSFLAQSAAPVRVSGELAAELTGRDDATALLEEMCRTVPFIDRVGRQGRWYRYHPLLRELLMGRLLPGEREQLQVRAGEWLVEHGDLGDGVDHLLTGGDQERATDVIVAHWLELVNSSADNIAAVDHWISQLDDELLENYVDLSIVGAWMALNRADYIRAEQHANGAIASPSETMVDGFPVANSAAAILANVARHRGDLAGSQDWSERALAGLDQQPVSAATVACTTVAGVAVFWSGDSAAAARLLSRGRVEGERIGEVVSAIQAAGYLAVLRADDGDTAAADEAAADCLGMIERHGLTGYHQAAMAHLARGITAEGAGEFDDARAELDAGYQLGVRSSEPFIVIRALAALADVAISQRRYAAARQALSEARSTLRRCSDAGGLHEIIGSIASRLPAPDPAMASSVIEPLTPRELTVLRLLDSRLTLQEIADDLYVSYNTVKTHTKAIYRKLDAGSRAEALRAAGNLPTS